MGKQRITGTVTSVHDGDTIVGGEHAQKDFYDRVVGTVFKPDCNQVNLNQLASGATCHDEACQCEIDIRQRQAYAAAHSAARTAKKGLWANVALSPWVHRNGVEAKVPAS